MPTQWVRAPAACSLRLTMEQLSSWQLLMLMFPMLIISPISQPMRRAGLHIHLHLSTKLAGLADNLMVIHPFSLCLWGCMMFVLCINSDMYWIIACHILPIPNENRCMKIVSSAVRKPLAEAAECNCWKESELMSSDQPWICCSSLFFVGFHICW